MSKKQKAYLGKQQIIDAKDTRYDEVDVPEWGGTVRIKSLSAATALKWAELNEQAAHKNSAGMRLVVISACDEDGAELFTTADLEALRTKSNKAMRRVVQKALAHNGFSESEQAALEQAAAEKNDSGETSADASPSDSAPT